MQRLIRAVRSAGATQPVIAQGLDWGGDLSGWLANRPADSAGQLVAGWHVYNFSGCNSPACWDVTVAPVAQVAPVLATEIGENDCAGGFLDKLLPWADAHGIGYVAWAWNTASCGGGPSLISDYSGTPTAYGAAYQQHLTRFDFEDGTTQGWSVRWGSTLTLSNEAGTAFTGTHGLAIDVSGPGYPGLGVDARPLGLVAGMPVTYRVWAPPGVAAGVAPMVFDGNWSATVIPDQPLSPGWNTVTFAVPPGNNGLSVLGLQIDVDGGWVGRLVLDSVAY